MRSMEESNMLLVHVAEHLKEIGNKTASDMFLKKANQIAKRARIIHDSVFRIASLSEGLMYEAKKNFKG